MDFTPEQIAYFNRMIEEAEEMQRQNGNRTYTPEEVMESLKITPEEIETAKKLRKEKIQNNEKVYTEAEIYDMFGIEDTTEEELAMLLQEEKRDYNRN